MEVLLGTAFVAMAIDARVGFVGLVVYTFFTEWL